MPPLSLGSSPEKVILYDCPTGRGNEGENKETHTVLELGLISVFAASLHGTIGVSLMVFFVEQPHTSVHSFSTALGFVFSHGVIMHASIHACMGQAGMLDRIFEK